MTPFEKTLSENHKSSDIGSTEFIMSAKRVPEPLIKRAVSCSLLKCYTIHFILHMIACLFLYSRRAADESTGKTDQDTSGGWVCSVFDSITVEPLLTATPE